MQTNVPGLFVIGTAAAGTQIRFKSFIETSHVHVARVVETITGKNIGETGFKPYELPES
jgi:thioredoxin reductase (NADPH)